MLQGPLRYEGIYHHSTMDNRKRKLTKERATLISYIVTPLSLSRPTLHHFTTFKFLDAGKFAS